MAETIMKYTSTLGIRRQDMSRYVLDREIGSVDTAYGKVRVKRASGMGAEKAKPEYEDVAALAREHHVSPETIRKAVREAARE